MLGTRQDVMMKKENRWLVITAGLGNSDFENASLRLIESVKI